MIWQRCLGVVAGVLLALSAVGTLSAEAGGRQVDEAALASAAKASPELVGTLAKEMGSTPEQAAGAAGALFSVAKSRLKADEFSQVAKAVPGMDSLLKAAPSAGSDSGMGGLSKVTGTTGSAVAGTAGTLAAAGGAFSKLGLKPEMASKAVPVLTSFVTKSGGADVGNMLAGALK